jgi:cell division protein ZapA (FtsZ GTPase activity inhibitor)
MIDTVTIELLNRSFKIKAGSDEEASALTAAGNRLNDAMRHIEKQSPALGFDKILLAVALNMAGESLDTEKQVTEETTSLREKMGLLQQRIEKTISHHATLSHTKVQPEQTSFEI